MIIFSSVGVLVGHFVNKVRFERYVFAEPAVQLADSNAKLAEREAVYAYYDQLTGLQNRRAFAEKLDQLSLDIPPDCCLVMADINGLKEINDTLGHKAGDELIFGTAECLRKSFESVDSIYRIGGDEFCVIMNNTEDSIRECLTQLETNCSNWTGKLIHDISISYGFASSMEFTDLDSLQKAADQRMYEFKSNYYKTSGKDRRRK